MNGYNSLTVALWAFTIAAQPILFALCLWRKVHHRLPWFPRYLAVESLGSLLLFAVHDYREYVVCFYLLAIASAICKIGIIFDVAGHVFSPYRGLPPGTIRKLLTLALVSVAVVCALVFRSHASNLDAAMNSLRTIDTALTAATVTGFWLIVIYSRKLGLYWRSQVAGIAVGFLLLLSVQTATKWVLLSASGNAAVLVRAVGQLSYLIALAAWFRYASLNEILPDFYAPTPGELRQLSRMMGAAEDALLHLKKSLHDKKCSSTAPWRRAA